MDAKTNESIKRKLFLVTGARVERYGKRLRKETILHLFHVPIFEGLL